MIYLDNAATTLIKPPTVESAMLDAMHGASSPGRGAHTAARRAAELVTEARETAARLFNVPSEEQIVFTMNATHALNIAISSLSSSGTKALVSGFEHNSVVRPLVSSGAVIMKAGRRLFDRGNTIDEFKRFMQDADICVCTYVSNAFGYILPIYEIGELCKKYGKPFIVDASQAAGALPVDFSALNADFVAMPGHKGLYGPQGTGILICGGEVRPIMSGGSGTDSRSPFMPEYLPDRAEAGTHNTPGIAGLDAGMKYVLQKGVSRIFTHEKQLLDIAASSMDETAGIRLWHGAEQSGVISFSVDGTDLENSAEKLDKLGFCLRSGLHCSPYSHISAGTVDTGTIRASFSSFTTEEEIKAFCEALKEIKNIS